MIRNIPDVLSIARAAILSPLIVLAAVLGRNELAFAAFILAAATDYFDGMIARKLCVAKKSSECMMESFADAVFGACTVAGAFAAGWISIVVVVWVVGLWIPFAGIFMLKAEGTRARRVSDTFCPLYYVIVTTLFAWLYAAKAFHTSLWIVALASLPILVIMAYQKRNRLNNWLHGKA